VSLLGFGAVNDSNAILGQGKSTLLSAISRGVYNHIPGGQSEKIELTVSR
jgi:predicted ABC-class ATPase